MPVPLASKAPVIKEWQTLRVNAQTAATHFNGKPQNVGVILGEVSGHLVDVDLDCGEAIALANDFLPFTASIFGRDSKPRSHWLYVARGATFAKFIDPQQGDTLLELRAGSGKQTVFPGSTHVSAEAVRWDIDGDVSEVARDDLETAVRTLAAAVLLARYWRAGDYHGTTLPLVGGMLRAGAPAVWLSKVLKAVGKAAGRQDLQDIDDAIKSTAAKLAEGQPVQGWPTLKEHMPAAVVDRVTQWLGLSQDAETAKARPFFTSWGEIAKRPREINYIVADLIEDRANVGLIGDPEAGKSLILSELLCCISSGTPFHGHEILGGGLAVLICGEGHGGVRRRVEAWALHNGVTLDETFPLIISERAAALIDPDNVKHVADEIEAAAIRFRLPVRVIGVDTLARNFGPGDENATGDMNAFVAAVDMLRDRFSATTITAHHLGHADKNRGRGSGAFKGALDVEFKVERNDAVVTLEATKMKDGPRPEAKTFEIVAVTLPRWTSNSGSTPTSAVLRLFAGLADVAPPIVSAVARYEHQKGGCVPNVRALADFMGKGKSTIAESLRNARAKGLISNENIALTPKGAALLGAKVCPVSRPDKTCPDGRPDKTGQHWT